MLISVFYVEKEKRHTGKSGYGVFDSQVEQLFLKISIRHAISGVVKVHIHKSETRQLNVQLSQ